ncbi:MAG: hypothetical protein CMP23_06185 [Rickettsiales bacterium]|nr:hypothetical protein [Rickettsiales bacterium]
MTSQQQSQAPLRQLKVLVTARDSEPVHGNVSLQDLSTGERRRRALKGLVICWILALISVPIMFFHFVLVPGFLIAGIVLYRIKFAESRLLTGGEIPCPGCQHPNQLGPQPEQWPMGLHCASCNLGISFEPEAA